MSMKRILLLILLCSIPSSAESMLLQGKRILVTGAGRGIGRAIALICHQEGAQVAIASRSACELQGTLDLMASATTTNNNNNNNKEEDPRTKMMMLLADVTNPQQVESMVQAIVEKWGGLDILINNAGGGQQPKGPVDTIESEALTKLLQLNVVGCHIVTSTVLKLAMPNDGNIVNISSKAGKVGLPNYSLYVASKFALEGMTSSWAKELKERNIVVNSLSPGMVNTQSFPKPPGKAGVRSAESIRDCLLLALSSSSGMKYTGHYVHADELDLVRSKGLPDTQAWKPIDEPNFEQTLEEESK
jgi:3-oxoacyl-[acyl-carrier protein] reductase